MANALEGKSAKATEWFKSGQPAARLQARSAGFKKVQLFAVFLGLGLGLPQVKLVKLPSIALDLHFCTPLNPCCPSIVFHIQVWCSNSDVEVQLCATLPLAKSGSQENPRIPPHPCDINVSVWTDSDVIGAGILILSEAIMPCDPGVAL